MSAKKLVVSTYLQHILIGLGALPLVVFIRQLSGVLLTFLRAATAALLIPVLGAFLGAVPVVAIVAATLRYLRGSLIFERWRKAPLAPATVGLAPARGGERAQAPDKGAKE